MRRLGRSDRSPGPASASLSRFALLPETSPLRGLCQELLTRHASVLSCNFGAVLDTSAKDVSALAAVNTWCAAIDFPGNGLLTRHTSVLSCNFVAILDTSAKDVSALAAINT